MYRSVALAAQRIGLDLAHADELGQLTTTLEFQFRWSDSGLRIIVNGEDWSDAIRTETVGKGASDVAVHAPVRAALLERQRALAREGGIVMDGRDIGSVVLPDADLKIFLDASVDEQAAGAMQSSWRGASTSAWIRFETRSQSETIGTERGPRHRSYRRKMLCIWTRQHVR